MEKVHILHTNDIHSHLNYWPRTAHFLTDQKATWNALDLTTAFNFELGDAVDRVHPLAEGTQGEGIIELLNAADYDAATVGNNEGVGEPKADLNKLYDDANFPVTIANLFDADTNKLPTWADEKLIFKSQDGTRFGVFGLTFPFEKSYGPLGWQVEEPVAIVEKIVKELSGSVDCIVLLSHLGIYFDRKIAETIEGVDVIIGSHTHHALPEGEWVKGTLLTGAGRYNEYVGHITLSFDNHSLQDAQAELISTNHIDSVPGEADIAREYAVRGNEFLEQNELAYLPKKLETDWHGQSTLGDFVMSAISDATGVDTVFLNAGLLVESLEKGLLTRSDLHSAFPHSMRLAKLTLAGDKMQNVFLEFEKNREERQYHELFGTGFRGKIFGDVLYKNIDVETDSFTVYFNGEKLQSDKTYTFATVDFFAFSPLFPLLSQDAEAELLFPDLFRDVIGQYAKKIYPIEMEGQHGS